MKQYVKQAFPISQMPHQRLWVLNSCSCSSETPKNTNCYTPIECWGIRGPAQRKRPRSAYMYCWVEHHLCSSEWLSSLLLIWALPDKTPRTHDPLNQAITLTVFPMQANFENFFNEDSRTRARQFFKDTSLIQSDKCVESFDSWRKCFNPRGFKLFLSD